MIPRGQQFTLARVTLTFLTPVGVGKGDAEGALDCPFVTDAGGKPAIPGTSIAGVLRSALPPRQADAWFGFQRGATGEASRVEVSWAHVHGADDRPAAFSASAGNDPVMRAMVRGVTRDHVHLGPRGVVAGREKFDETLVPAGARFTFELKVHEPLAAESSEKSADALLDHLLALLRGGGVVLGGRTRRGHGRFVVTRVLRGRFNLASPADRERISRLPVDLALPLPPGLLADDNEKVMVSPEPLLTVRAALKPADFWYFGGGTATRPEHRKGTGAEQKQVQGIPYSETRVRWTGAGSLQQGSMTPEGEEEYVFVASAVKGALRHRTAFHFRALQAAIPGAERGRWVAGTRHAAEPGIPAEVEELFGAIKKGDEGRPGRVFVEEFTVTKSSHGRLDHVSIDRFTQGPVDGALFDETPLRGGELMTLTIHIDRRGGVIEPTARAAFRAALHDLLAERLALGAAQNRGHGFFAGILQDDGALDRWVEEGK